MSTRWYKFTSLIQAIFFFNAYTKAVDCFKHRLQTGFLPSAIGCALFITSQVVLKS